MSKRIFYTVINAVCLLGSSGLWAQWHFSSVNTVQVLQGKNVISAAVHSVNGWGHGRFFAGIGTGLDAYRQLTIPVFVEGRMRLAGTRKQLQGWLNGGAQVPLKKDGLGFPGNGPLRPGWLQAGGMDYLVPLHKLQALIGIGYSRKSFGQMETAQIWNPATSRLETVQRKSSYVLQRLSLRMGLVF